jgi:hypothetical protein
VWLPIKSHTNYEVSSTGRVRNVKSGRILSQGTDGHGYSTVFLYKHSKESNPKVHRLVAAAFHENPENKQMVDHENPENKQMCVITYQL